MKCYNTSRNASSA